MRHKSLRKEREMPWSCTKPDWLESLLNLAQFRQEHFSKQIAVALSKKKVYKTHLKYMDAIWYIIHHEMSKSTQAFSVSQSNLHWLQHKSHSPVHRPLTWIPWTAVYSHLGILESELLIETRSSNRNHKICNMDKLTLTIFPLLKSSHQPTEFQKISLLFGKLQDYSNSFPSNFLEMPSILFKTSLTFFSPEGIGVIKINKNIFNPQEFWPNRTGSLQ